MRGAESSVPKEPRTAKGKPGRKRILESMRVLSGRVINAPGGNDDSQLVKVNISKLSRKSFLCSYIEHRTQVRNSRGKVIL